METNQPQVKTRPEPYIPEPDPNVSFEDWLVARTQNWIKEFQSVFGHEGECGRNRHVFSTTNYVYKVPLGMEGISDNYHEEEQQGGHFAECWVEHDADGIPILIMERVTLAVFRDLDRAPSWVFGVDCVQVGYSVRTGRLVAFDFGWF